MKMKGLMINNSGPQIFNGIRFFIVDPVKHTCEKKRTWRQRLFTLPFRPFVRSTTVTTWAEFVADGEVIQNAEGVFMNAKTFDEFKKGLGDE